MGNPWVKPDTTFDEERIDAAKFQYCDDIPHDNYIPCSPISDENDNSDKCLKIESQLPTSNEDCNQNVVITPDSITQKPKSILVLHESEVSLDKKTKSNRSVSFTLDDSKKPFTSSIYYGVKSYLHHFYEPVNKTANGDSFVDDDFEFVVEPGFPRKKFWIIAIFVFGVLLILGSICIVNVIDIETLSSRTLSDQFESLAFEMAFCGGFVIVFSLFAYAYVAQIWCFKILHERNKQYPAISSDCGNTWIRYAEGLPLPLDDHRIPISEEVTTPQMDRSKK